MKSKEKDVYKRTLIGLALFTLIGVGGLTCSMTADAQVSVYTNPQADSITFETYKATTIVVPKTPAVSVDIPTTYGTSSFYVSPGGYVSPSYTTEDDQ